MKQQHRKHQNTLTIAKQTQIQCQHIKYEIQHTTANQTKIGHPKR